MSRRGNPFTSKAKQQDDLLAGGLRSDEWQEDDQEEPAPLSNGSQTAAAQPIGQPTARGAAPGPAAAAAVAPPPPPPPVAGVPLPPGEPAAGLPVYPPQPLGGSYGAYPAPSATAPPGAVTDDALYPPPITAASGAWGQQLGYQPQQPGVYGVSSAGGGDPYGGPAGYPPGYAPQQAPAWTGGYASDAPLAFTSFATEAAPRPPMRCMGWGEQWTLFLCGILIWPLWYFAVIWYCFSKTQSTDPRQRTPFIINCVASFIFTFIWVAIVVRETSGGWGGYDGYWR